MNVAMFLRVFSSKSCEEGTDAYEEASESRDRVADCRQFQCGGRIPAGESGPRRHLQNVGVGANVGMELRCRRVGLQLPLKRAIGTFLLVCGAALAAPLSISSVSVGGLAGAHPSGLVWSAEAKAWLVTTIKGLMKVPFEAQSAETWASTEILGVTGGPIHAAATSPGRLLTYSLADDRYRAYERDTFKPILDTKGGALGFSAMGAIGWLGERWILVGRPHSPKQPRYQIQLRSPDDLRFIDGLVLPLNEQETLRYVLEYGSVTVSPKGDRALVLFQALRRVTLVSASGAMEFLEAPIPNGRALEDTSGGFYPRSPDDYAKIYAGKRIVVGGGWMGERPVVVTADVGAGERALRVHIFLAGHGNPTEVGIDVASPDPRDAFVGSVASVGDRTRLLLLVSRFKGVSAGSAREVLVLDLLGYR
jgi:hypothetical protein